MIQLLIKQRKIKLSIVTLLIVTNTVLVLHFGPTKFSLFESLEPFKNLFNTETDFDSPSIKEHSVHLTQKDLNQTIEETANSELLGETSDAANYIQHGELLQIGGACSMPIHMQQQKNIYKWQDDNGITNISDKPRKIYSDSPVTIIGTIEPEMVAINYINSTGFYNLQNKINGRVMKAMNMFERVVSKSLVTPVSINFRLFEDQDSYVSYRKRIAPNLGASLGFYMGNTNESVVMMTSEIQGTNTAVHEAMHAINRHWFGKMSRWLNEGIAQYAEIDPSVPLQHNSWFSSIQRKKLISLSKLFQANKLEWKSQVSQMYETSRAFVAYLMDEQRAILSRLLMEESYNSCGILNLQDIERVSGKSVSVMQREFDSWQSSISR